MAVEDDPTEERRDGPTPAGGAYSVAYYSDGRGRRLPKSRATAAEVVEFDAAGRAIHRTYLARNPTDSEAR